MLTTAFERKAQIDLGNNLLQGIIPTEIFSCENLTHLDFSRNNLVGEINAEIGNLLQLKIANLYKNRLTGSIPVKMFDIISMEQLMLQSNKLTGSIPTEIGRLMNMTKISMSHNLLKGNIPVELENLKNLELLQLHQNRLTGTSPKLEARSDRMESFITDCGDPSFLQDSPLKCESCTMCCNSENKCQENHIWDPPIWVYPSLVALITPFLVAFIIYLISYKVALIEDTRHPLSIYRDDSVYCFIYSKSVAARFVYVLTVTVQFMLFLAFMWASDSSNEDSDFEYNFRCTDNSLECIDLNNDTPSGWALIVILNILYLGVDVVHGVLQIRKGVFLGDLELLASGCVLLFLTILAMGTTLLYNYALAETTTNMIVNAVILLFINDIDEKFMTVLKSTAPFWIDRRIMEVKRGMSRKINPNQQSTLAMVTEDDFTSTEKNILKCMVKDWTDKKIQDSIIAQLDTPVSLDSIGL